MDIKRNTVELSIIIPIYNVEEYLDECLQSIVNQVEYGVEVILINDGSTDNSKKICEDYIKKYNYIALINQENRGLSAARNRGVSQARGKYLLFLDSDDFLCERVLEELMPALNNTTADFLIGKKELYIDKTGVYIESTEDYINLKNSLESCKIFEILVQKDPFWFMVSLIVIKKDYLIENNLYFKEGIYHEDELWVLLIFFFAKNVLVFDKSIYCYRVGRPNSIANSIMIKRGYDRLLIADEYDAIVRDHQTDIVWKRIFKSRRAMLLWIVILELDLYKNIPGNSELRRQIRKRIKYLKSGKYIVGFIGCIILGINNMSILNRFRIRLINKLYQ